MSILSGSQRAPFTMGLDASEGPSGRETHLQHLAGLKTPVDRLSLRLEMARANRLRHGFQASVMVATLTCVVLALVWSFGGPERVSAGLIGPWIGLGVLAWAVRLLGRRLSSRALAGDASASEVRSLLGLSAVASAADGLMLAWGWVGVLPGMSGLGVDILLMAHVAVLLVSLCTSGVHVPSLLALILASTLPWLTALGSDASAPDSRWMFLLGLGVVSLVALGFSMRFSREFHDTFMLRDRVERLLSEVSVKHDEAVHANQAKSRFLASVSHDLRQPMHAMSLYLAAVAGHFDKLCAAPGDAASARCVHEGIRSLQDSTLHLNAMFESLLDISRLNAGSVAVTIRHTTLHRMMAQLKADYAHQAAAQGLRFDLRVPPRFHLMEVHTDPALLERLLRNLLVNAFRYTRSGGVRLSVVARGRSLDFRVVDTGPGIERAARQRVFEEFFQVPGSQEAAAAVAPMDRHPRSGHRSSAWPRGASQGLGRGIGLGLSISARLADKLGAPIRLHSRIGHGSVFAIRQPVRVALRPKSDALAVAQHAASIRLPSGLFLAVIDDDREIRRSTSQMLEVMGVEVYAAESAEQAVQHLGLSGRVPDLLISDYRLGAHNGIQAIAQLREEFNRDIPAILITGDTSPAHIERFRSTGLQVLYKPLSGPQLVAAVAEELRRVKSVGP